MLVSIICVYNDEIQFKTQLMKSLDNQEQQFEIIAIDNTSGKFKSAAEAINYGSEKAKGELLVFVHQDIIFKTSKEIKTICEFCDSKPIGTVVGAIGVKDGSKEYIGNWTSGEDITLELNSNYFMPQTVSTIDEAVIVIKKETWKQHNFNTELCDSWHMYAVEMCLWNRKHGNDIYVVPIQIHHYSHGHINYDYMKTFKRIADYYRSDFKYIWTTCYKSSSSWVKVRLLVVSWILFRKLRGKNLK